MHLLFRLMANSADYFEVRSEETRIGKVNGITASNAYETLSASWMGLALEQSEGSLDSGGKLKKSRMLRTLQI